MSDWTSVSEAVEEYGAVEESVSFLGQHSCKVTMRCPWGKRIDVAADMILNARLWPDAPIGAIAGRATIKPVAGEATVDGGGKLVYEEALVTVTYDTSTLANIEKVPDGPMAGELYSETIEKVIENQTLDRGGFCWVGDQSPGDESKGLALLADPVRQTYSAAIKRVWFNVTSIPSAYWDLAGTVNQAAYTSVPLGKTFAAESLLFIPGAADRVVTTDGAKAWHLPMKLAIREQGWNKFWNPHKSGSDKYDTIWDKVNDEEYKNFPPADWSDVVF